jgi:hypothetical protein
MGTRPDGGARSGCHEHFLSSQTASARFTDVQTNAHTTAQNERATPIASQIERLIGQVESLESTDLGWSIKDHW